MKREEYGLLLTTVIASSIGGAAKSYLFRDEVVTAQEPSTNAKILVVEEFQLVDKNDRTRAFLGLRHDGHPGLSLLDQGRKIRAQLDVYGPARQERRSALPEGQWLTDSRLGG